MTASLVARVRPIAVIVVRIGLVDGRAKSIRSRELIGRIIQVIRCFAGMQMIDVLGQSIGDVELPTVVRDGFFRRSRDGKGGRESLIRTAGQAKNRAKLKINERRPEWHQIKF